MFSFLEDMNVSGKLDEKRKKICSGGERKKMKENKMTKICYTQV